MGWVLDVSTDWVLNVIKFDAKRNNPLVLNVINPKAKKAEQH